MPQPGSANFLISLDFEMYWGLRASPGISEALRRLQRVPEIVQAMLDIFGKYEIRATWATVGLLGLNDLDEARASIPDSRPLYANAKLDPYRDIQSDEIERLPLEVLFAPALLKRIAESPGQELASHSFSHMYCLADGVSREAFAEDIDLAGRVFGRFGTEPTSFVFPRNQDACWAIELLRERNYKTWRAGGKRWVSRGVARKSAVLKAARLIDSISPWSRRDMFTVEPIAAGDGLLELPASRFFRVSGSGGKIYQQLCIDNVKREMDAAVKNNSVYHLWWHPHNLSNQSVKSLQRLEIVLRHFQMHAQRGDMTSVNMSDLSARCPI